MLKELKKDYLNKVSDIMEDEKVDYEFARELAYKSLKHRYKFLSGEVSKKLISMLEEIYNA